MNDQILAPLPTITMDMTAAPAGYYAGVALSSGNDFPK